MTNPIEIALQHAYAMEAHSYVKRALERLRKIDVDLLLEDATKDSIRRLVETEEDTRKLAEYAAERLEEARWKG